MKKSFQTTNYDIFKTYAFNREVINELNINAIMAEMKIGGFDEWNPIVVSRTGYVADGQHRLEAAKRLGIPVYVDQYDREFTAEDIKRMNRNRINWKLADFLHANINDKKSIMAYRFVRDCNKVGISDGAALRIACAANHRDQNTRRSDMGLNDEELKNANQLVAELIRLKEYIPNATSANFVGSYMRAKSCDNFDIETFIDKLKRNKFICYTSMNDIISEIEEIYNYRNKIRININRNGIKTRR